jgi:CheY-like chemotaxis protein
MIERVLPENIRIQTRIDDDVPAIHADPSQLHQVLLNLCLNARDAMPRGGTLELSAKLAPAERGEGPWVALSVRDTGIGMDRETLDKAFDPFFTTKGALGTGLGLSSVHGIVEQSGGHVRVQSAPNLGSTFTILLPPADPEALGAAGSDERATRPASARASGTVLVAEDDTGVRELMVAALKSAGYEVVAAESGSAALELARRYRGTIDLLCADGIMPGISSSQLIADFRVLFPHARVLVCSGHIAEESLRGQVERSGLRYLSKPFTGAELVRMASETLAAS